MPTVEPEDKVCMECGARGVLIADQFGSCTTCGDRDVRPWESLTEDEQEGIANQ